MVHFKFVIEIKDCRVGQPKRLNVITKIPISVPVDKVYSRLGRNRHINELAESQKKRIDEAIAAGFALCDLKGVWLRLKIIECDAGTVVLENNVVFESAALVKLLKKSTDVILFAATAGADIVENVSAVGMQGDGVRALVYDAVGSESADDAMNWMQGYLNQYFKRFGEQLTKRRFSAGYGDLSLDTQRVFYELLELEKLGIVITDECILRPEKTVTAIAGVERII
jgi:hypothetical protein